jgi:hypothetical protein
MLSPLDDVDADAEGENSGQQIKVIVALQVVNVRASGGIKHESDVADLTGTFFLPANLSGTGILSPETDSIPWIPRDLLFPVIDNALIDILVSSDLAQGRRIVEKEILSCEKRENNYKSRLSAW